MEDIKTEKAKAKPMDAEAVLKVYATSPDACPFCGHIGEMVDRGCKLVCGGCEMFVFSSCSDVY